MTTTHTTTIAAAFPTDQATEIHAAVEQVATPAGDRFFDPKRATHTDASGEPWQVVEAPARPERAAAFAALQEHFPTARFAVTAEVVPVREIAGRSIIWRDKSVAMVRIPGAREAVTDGLETVEVDNG